MDEARFLEWTDQHQRVDETQFILLIEQHQRVIGKICRLYRNAGEEWDHLFQEIVYQLWKSASSNNERVKTGSWLYRTALSTAIATNVLETSKKTDAQQTQHTYSDHKEQLINALKQLTDDDKAIITLYLEGLGLPEIAEITGLAETVAGVKLNRIKKKIQQLTDQKEQYPLRSIWQNIDATTKNGAELQYMIADRCRPASGFLNNPIPYMLSKSLAKGSDIKKTLEDQLFRIRSFAILIAISRVIVAGCLSLLANFTFVNNMARYWVLGAVILIFATHIALLSNTWAKKFRQMKNTIEHLRHQREFIKNVD